MFARLFGLLAMLVATSTFLGCEASNTQVASLAGGLIVPFQSRARPNPPGERTILLTCRAPAVEVDNGSRLIVVVDFYGGRLQDRSRIWVWNGSAYFWSRRPELPVNTDAETETQMYQSNWRGGFTRNPLPATELRFSASSVNRRWYTFRMTQQPVTGPGEYPFSFSSTGGPEGDRNGSGTFTCTRPQTPPVVQGPSIE